MKKYVLKYKATQTPITTPVNKLGGNPVWLENAQWPAGTSGEPMMFVCQIELKYILPNAVGKLAYVFFNDDPLCEGYTEPDGGDTAVIIQPGGQYNRPTFPLRIGPSIYQRSWKGLTESRRPVEFLMEMSESDEAEVDAWDDVDPNDSDAFNKYFGALKEDKIAGHGVPTINGMGFSFPVPDDWRLLIQINSVDDGGEYFLSMAGDGTGYAFISPDARRGAFFFDR